MLIPALNAGGAERVMVTLANEWAKENEVTIMVFNDGYCFYELSDKVKIIAMNISLPLKGIRRYISIPAVEYKRFININRKIKQGAYDFILSFCYTTNLMASVISMVQHKKNIVISERNDPYCYSKWVSRLINILYKKNVAVVCQNRMVKDYFQKKGFKNHLPILPNPVNFADIPENRPKLMRREIVTVGRLIDQKNHKILIEAFNEIKDEFPQYELKIYGIGPCEKDLKEQISRLNLNNRVYLMGTQPKVMFKVNEASVFVLPSNFEGFPNVLIEAMGTGLPVISSKFKTGIAELLVTSDRNGYLFEVGNKDELVNCLRMLLKREKQFLDMGKENRKIALKYRDEVVAKKWLDTISKCIK